MSVVTAGRVPDPLEWHPAYAGMTDLLDWLNGTGPFADRWDIRIPRPPLPKITATFDPEQTAIVIPHATLTKRKCAGSAPYVGRPFKYLWIVATDELGRAIAADAKPWYNPADEYAQRWPDPYAVPLAWWEDDVL